MLYSAQRGKADVHRVLLQLVSSCGSIMLSSCVFALAAVFRSVFLARVPHTSW